MWECTSAEVARAKAWFEPMEIYIRKRKNTVVQYIATRPILDLLEAKERTGGVKVDRCGGSRGRRGWTRGIKGGGIKRKTPDLGQQQRI